MEAPSPIFSPFLGLFRPIVCSYFLMKFGIFSEADFHFQVQVQLYIFGWLFYGILSSPSYLFGGSYCI